FQLLRVQALSNLVALAGGLLVAGLRGKREPFVRFGKIALDAVTACIQDAEIVLTVDDAVGGSLAEPFRGGCKVRPAVDAARVEHSEIVHRLGMSLGGGVHIKAARLGQVFPDAESLFIHAAKTKLSRSEARLCSPPQPGGGHDEIAGRVAALRETNGYLVA